MPGELQQIKAAIDTYLGAGSLLPDFDDIVEIYVDNVMKFKELKEKVDEISELNPEVSKEEINEMIKEERKKAVQEVKTRLRVEIENKVNSLKAAIAEIKDAVVSIPKELAKGIAEAAMPTMIAPGSPNPASSALRLIINALRIKAQIDGILRATSYSIGLINELGLQELPVSENLAALVKPLVSVKQKAEAQESSNEEASTEYPPSPKSYKAKDPSNNEITGLDIQQQAQKYKIVFPVKGFVENKIVKRLQKGTPIEKQWAEIFTEYNKWLDSVKQLKP